MNIRLGPPQYWIAGLILLVARLLMQIFIPSRLDPDYTPKSEYGLVPGVDCFNSKLTETGVDIVFVHGLGSNPDTTWQKLAKSDAHDGADVSSLEKSYVNWVTDFLCDDLPPNVKQTVRIFFYNYDSYWKRDAIEERRSRLGQELFEEVTSTAVKTPERSIVFVGHSYGGLVIKEALVKAYFLQSWRPVSIYKQTKAVLFLGTPHRGSASAWFGVKVAQVLRAFGLNASPAIVQAVTYDSIELQDMHRTFEAISDHLQIINFYEKRKTVACWGLWRSLVVTEQSATMDRPDAAPIGLHTDHSGLNKFEKRDSNYKMIRKTLIKLMEAIIEGKPRLKRGTIGVSEGLGGDFREYHIPFQLDFSRNHKFTGRSDILEHAHDFLGRNKERNGPNIVVLQGTGGIGKTELAIEYAYMHHESYSSVFWVDCSTENSVRLSFLRIASQVLRHYTGKEFELATFNTSTARLGLSGLVDKNSFNFTLDGCALEVVEAMRKWFAERLNKEWLLVFDNLDDLESFDIMDYFPRTMWGSILITSRRREFSSYWTTMEVSEMSPEEGLSLLAKSARFGRELNHDDQRLALKLLQFLDYFPLAIEQAGAYISHHVSDDSRSYYHALANYLDLYQRNAKTLLQYKRPSSIWNYRNDTVLTTWEVSFDAIRKQRPEASDLLLLCGFLANSDIFEEMFRLGRKLSVNDTTVQESIHMLSSYSLVRFKGRSDAFSIHPLVQFWARERLTLDVQQRLAKQALQLIARGLRLKKAKEISDYFFFEQRIIPHLDSAVYNMQIFSSSSFKTELSILPPSNSTRQIIRSVFYNVAEGWYLWLWGVVTEISMSYRRYMHSDIESMSEEWQLAYKIGTIYRDRELYQSAERIYRWAFAEARTRLHDEHPKSLEIAGDLAWAIYLQGRYDDSSDWYNWLLTSRRKVLGEEHPSTMGAVKALASIFGKRGDDEASLRLYFEALAGRQKRLGKNDILTLNVMMDIADVFERQGNYDKALSWLQHILAVQQETLGENHKDTLRTNYRIGIILNRQEMLNKALSWYQQVLARQQEMLGEKHQDTLYTIHHIGLIFIKQGKLDEALSWHQRALARRQELIGENNQHTLQTIHNIGLIFDMQGKLDEALSWYQRALAGRQELLGENDQDTLQTVHNIGLIFNMQGNYDEALSWYQRALAGRQETLGENDESTLHTIYCIGLVFDKQGKLDEALSWYQRALAGQQETLGENDEYTLHIIYRIGLVFDKQGNYDEALSWYQRALAGYQETLGEKHKSTLHTTYKIGFIERQRKLSH